MRVTEGRFALEGNSDGRGHDDRAGRRDRPGSIGRGIARSVGSDTQRSGGRSRSTGCRERLSSAVPAIGESGAGDRVSRSAGGAAGAGNRGRLIDSSKGPWIVTVTDAEPDPDGDATNPAGRDARPVGGADSHADARSDADPDAETHEATEEPEATEVAATAVIRRAMLLQREGGTSTRP
jgi:hypothetical protein